MARAGLSRTFQKPEPVSMHERAGERHGGPPQAEPPGVFFVRRALAGPGPEERAIRQAALAQLDYVGLTDLAACPAGALAFGQRRMVELGRALAAEPELLLLDEPGERAEYKRKGGLGRADSQNFASGALRFCSSA